MNRIFLGKVQPLGHLPRFPISDSIPKNHHFWWNPNANHVRNHGNHIMPAILWQSKADQATPNHDRCSTPRLHRLMGRFWFKHMLREKHHGENCTGIVYPYSYAEIYPLITGSKPPSKALKGKQIWSIYSSKASTFGVNHFELIQAVHMYRTFHLIVAPNS